MQILDKTKQGRSNEKYFFIIILLVSFNFISCLERFTPESRIIAVTQNAKISNYQFEKIALLPLLNDDTTNTGTFYSTNHFLIKLTKQYSKINFDIPGINFILKSDSLVIPRLIDTIELKRYLDLDSFYVSELGIFLEQEKFDAVFIGTLEHCYDLNGFDRFDWSPGNLYFERIYLRNCYFSYYLISLDDGKVLWGARVLGQDANYLDPEFLYTSNGQSKFYFYPPVDCAISNGIDVMMSAMPVLKGKRE
jgi:hypothetical protein